MPKRGRSRSPVHGQLSSLLSIVLVVGILYFGKAVLVPLVLALLLAFILWPLVHAVQQRGLARVPATLIVVGATLIIMGATAWGVGIQLSRLANGLDTYSGQVRSRIAMIQASGSGPVPKLLSTFGMVEDASKKQAQTKALSDSTNPPTTQPIIVAQAPLVSPLERLESNAAMVIEPLADAALVLILVIYTLIKREDLRNRVIGLLGHGHMTGATRVFVDSADKISKLLLVQLAVNAAFGFVFGVALFFIGVQYWFLFGFLTAVLRFVPYVGTWLAASLPLLLSFAMAPSLAQPVIVLITFIVLDTVSANAIEPTLFGHSTGVSPVALLIAAVFWTWVWGPVGLVLSTPVTVCLVVLGQHYPRFKYLALLLGDEPALPPYLAYYQRLLAGDATEARLIVKEHQATNGIDSLPDEVLTPALRLARRDRSADALSSEDETFIYTTTEQVIADRQAECAKMLVKAGLDESCLPMVLGCTAHHRSEELIVRMLEGCENPLFRLKLMSSQMLPTDIEEAVKTEKPDLVFIAVMPPGGISQARYLCRRLRKQFKDMRIIVGYFGRVRDFDALLVRLRAAGATYVTTSVLQSWNHIRPLLRPPPQPARDNPLLLSTTP